MKRAYLRPLLLPPAVLLFVLAALLSSRMGQRESLAAQPERQVGRLQAHPERNRVNLAVRNLPTSWDLGKGTNVRWSAAVGSKAYGGPVVAAGKVFVGNEDGSMLVFKHGKKKQLLAQNAMDGYLRTWQSADADTLYVIPESTTRLYAIGSK
jgi:PQQ-like domain